MNSSVRVAWAVGPERKMRIARELVSSAFERVELAPGRIESGEQGVGGLSVRKIRAVVLQAVE